MHCISLDFTADFNVTSLLWPNALLGCVVLRIGSIRGKSFADYVLRGEFGLAIKNKIF